MGFLYVQVYMGVRLRRLVGILVVHNLPHWGGGGWTKWKR